METKRKSNSVVTVQQDGESVLVFNVLGAGSIRFDTAAAHETLQHRAAMHGWKQRIADAAAISRNPETGKPATPAEKYESMLALVEHYMTGTAEWARRGEGGGGAQSLTLLAIARVRGITYQAAADSVTAYATEKFAGDTKKAMAFFRSARSVKAAILEIQSERLPEASIDADDALAELGE